MLLKVAILHRGGRIREPRVKQTIGFDACLRKGLSDGAVKFLNDTQTLTLQIINSLRDAAQHHLLDISEQHLYIQAQAGLTVFREIFRDVFAEDLHALLPKRALPLSTTPPTDLATLLDNEVKEIQKLLSPGSRRRTEAEARLRALAIVESSISGEKVQPGVTDLKRLADQISAGKKSWDAIFPGVATLTVTAKGHGPSIDLRIAKTGVPVHSAGYRRQESFAERTYPGGQNFGNPLLPLAVLLASEEAAWHNRPGGERVRGDTPCCEWTDAIAE